MVKIAVFASGTGSNFERLVLAKKDNPKLNYEIKLLVVDKEGCGAFFKSKALGIPAIYLNPKAFENKAQYETALLNILKENKIELIALAGFMRILGNTFLEGFKNPILNIHPAYLPEFPGKDGIGDAFKAKVKKTGVTIHYVDLGIDTGEIIYQEKITIDPVWDLDTLKNEIHKIEHRIYPDTLNKVCINLTQDYIGGEIL